MLDGFHAQMIISKVSIMLTLRLSTFHSHRDEAAAALKEGQAQLKVLKRQAIVGQLYPSASSVMES